MSRRKFPWRGPRPRKGDLTAVIIEGGHEIYEGVCIGESDGKYLIITNCDGRIKDWIVDEQQYKNKECTSGCFSRRHDVRRMLDVKKYGGEMERLLRFVNHVI